MKPSTPPNNPLLPMAERCKEVIDGWLGKTIDPNRDGLRLIAEFAYALDCHVDIKLKVGPHERPSTIDPY